MNKVTSVIITAILFFGFGYLVNGSMKMDHDMDTKMEMKTMEEGIDHDHAMGEETPHEHSMMKHELLDVTEWENKPSVEVQVLKDPKSGWNVQASVENFTFSPENASLDHIEGEGHAHIYIDGKKITRLYSEWYHIPELASGEHEIKVTLNANTHDDLAIGEEIISDSVKVTVE